MMGPMRSMSGGPPRPIKKTTLSRIARTFLPYRKEMIWTALAVLASAALGLLSPFFLKIIVNDGLLARRLGVVTMFTIWTLLATILATTFSLGYSYMSIVVGQQIGRASCRERV